jgi:hypothetical protein
MTMTTKIADIPNTKVAGLMIEGIGLIIGEFENGRLKKPRAVQTQQHPETKQSMIRLVELVGYPNELYFTREPVFFYKVLDKDTINAYTQATTNLVLPNSLEVIK